MQCVFTCHLILEIVNIVAKEQSSVDADHCNVFISPGITYNSFFSYAPSLTLCPDTLMKPGKSNNVFSAADGSCLLSFWLDLTLHFLLLLLCY